MGINHKNQKDKQVDQLAKMAFGLDEEQLNKEFQEAQELIKDEDLPETPKGDFQKLLARIEKDKKVAGAVEEETVTEDSSEKEPLKGNVKVPRFRLKKMGRVLVVAAVLVTVSTAMMFTGLGDKHYYFTWKIRDEIKGNWVVDNDEVLVISTPEEEAYKEAEQMFEQDILELGYRPEDLRFENYSMIDSQVLFTYVVNRAYLYIRVLKRDSSSTYNIVFDSEEVSSCKNEWLDQDLRIEGRDTDSGIEYNTVITMDNVLYCIYGRVELEEFKKIVEDMHE